MIEVGGRGARVGGSTSTATVVAQPSHGKVVVNADGGFVYTPSAAFVGTDSFTYTVSSGGATSEAAKVTIVVK